MDLNNDIIDTIRQRLVEAYNPEAIMLFGSYAWGSPNEDSDLDLIIIIDTNNKPGSPRAYKGHKALADIHIPKDLLVVTKDEFYRQADNISTLFYKIKKEAKLLYGTI